jgi:integrase/predicted RNA-binding Zn-ribbon protein involved in translation (DUF1610 family)
VVEEGEAAHTGAEERILDKSGLNTAGERSEMNAPAVQPPKQPHLRACPECGSERLYKDGIRATAQGDVQRYLCRDCGLRFSHLGSTRKSEWKLNSRSTIFSKRQVCVLLTEESKNLTEVEPEKIAQREGTGVAPDQATVKGLLAQFAAWLERQGFKGSTYYGNIKTLVASGANILDPEDVKRVIARLKKKNGEPWCDTAKMMMRYSYDAFAKMLGITWTPPKYKQRDFEAFIPDESELDTLIASCRSKRMATYLQCLKETFGDPTEVLRLRWIDVTNNVITIAQPVKNHLPRQLEVSQKLLSMLNNLPKSEERIFPTTYATMANAFMNLRKRAAQKLQNPRLSKISLTGFRHWGGTMLAYYTNGNVLTVKKLLGHRRVENTMKYIGRLQFKDDRFEIATATTDDEIKQLGSAGFEKYDEHNGVHFYRKPKKFKA